MQIALLIAALLVIAKVWKQPKFQWKTDYDMIHPLKVWEDLYIICLDIHKKLVILGFPGGAVVRNLPANAGDMGSSPGQGGSHIPWSN